MQADRPVEVIAEIGANHHNDFRDGERLLDALVESDIRYVKFQLWKKEDVWASIPRDVVEPDPDVVLALVKRAAELGLVPGCSISSPGMSKILKDAPLGFWKLPAAQIGRRELWKELFDAPLFFSTSFVPFQKVAEFQQNFHLSIPLVCVSEYPATSGSYCLGLWSKQLVSQEWGVSDHTEGLGMALGAVALGAKWIEKHVKLGDRKSRDNGPHVMSPSQLGILETEALRTWEAVFLNEPKEISVRKVFPFV